MIISTPPPSTQLGYFFTEGSWRPRNLVTYPPKVDCKKADTIDEHCLFLFAACQKLHFWGYRNLVTFFPKVDYQNPDTADEYISLKLESGTWNLKRGTSSVQHIQQINSK